MVEGRRRAEPGGQRRRARAGRRGSSRCAAAARRRVSSAVTSPGEQAEARGALVLGRRTRTAAACRGRCRAAARRPPRARAAASSSPSARRLRIASREGADARDDDPVGGGDLGGVARDRRARRRRARAPSRPSGGCPCRSRRSRSQQRPWSTGRRVSSGSIATAARSARANALKQASIMWWAFVPGLQLDVQGQPRARRDGAEELLGGLVLEAGDVARRQRRGRRRRRTGGRRGRSSPAARASSIGITAWP